MQVVIEGVAGASFDVLITVRFTRVINYPNLPVNITASLIKNSFT